MSTVGLLSWQQAMSLRRHHELGVGTAQLISVVPLPLDQPVSHLYERMTRMAEREDVLRITRLPNDGLGMATYADEIDPPVFMERADTRQRLGALLAELQEPRLNYEDGQPLWRVVILDHPDRTGEPARTVLAVLDHQICDRISFVEFRDELAGLDHDREHRSAGSYQEWVAWQRTQFPMENAGGVPTAAREFWRRYLDGSAPNYACPLPFYRPDAGYSGLEFNMYRALPDHVAAALKDTGIGLSTSPFLLFVAGIAAAVGGQSGENDMVLRYFALGRTPRNLHMMGWFADYIPLRIKAECLADPEQALSAATSSRLEVLEHEATPWGYIMGACSQTDAETPQIVLNFVELDEGIAAHMPKQVEGTVPGVRGYIFMTVFLRRNGPCVVECRFDPERFDKAGVEKLVSAVIENITRLLPAFRGRHKLGQ